MQAQSSGLAISYVVTDADFYGQKALRFHMRDDLTPQQVHEWWCGIAVPILDADSDGSEVAVSIQRRGVRFNRKCP